MREDYFFAPDSRARASRRPASARIAAMRARVGWRGRETLKTPTDGAARGVEDGARAGVSGGVRAVVGANRGVCIA